MSKNDSLYQEFLSEALEHLQNIEEDLLHLEQQGKNFDKNVVDRLFRAMHSIKGTSSFLELINITELAHTLESVVDYIRGRKLYPSEQIVQSLLNGVDTLNEMIQNLDKQHTYSITAVVDPLRQLMMSPVMKETPSKQTVKPEVEPAPVRSEEIISEEKKASIKSTIETSLKSEKSTGNEQSSSDKPQTSESAQSDKIDAMEMETEDPFEKEQQQLIAAFSPLHKDLHLKHLNKEFTIKLDLFKECDEKNRNLVELIRELRFIGEIENAVIQSEKMTTAKKEKILNEANPLYFIGKVRTPIDKQSLFLETLNISPLEINFVVADEKKSIIEVFSIMDIQKYMPTSVKKDATNESIRVGTEESTKTETVEASSVNVLEKEEQNNAGSAPTEELEQSAADSAESVNSAQSEDSNSNLYRSENTYSRNSKKGKRGKQADSTVKK